MTFSFQFVYFTVASDPSVISNLQKFPFVNDNTIINILVFLGPGFLAVACRCQLLTQASITSMW